MVLDGISLIFIRLPTRLFLSRFLSIASQKKISQTSTRMFHQLIINGLVFLGKSEPENPMVFFPIKNMGRSCIFSRENPIQWWCEWTSINVHVFHDEQCFILSIRAMTTLLSNTHTHTHTKTTILSSGHKKGVARHVSDHIPNALILTAPGSICKWVNSLLFLDAESLHPHGKKCKPWPIPQWDHAATVEISI